MLTCKETARLVSDQLDRKLPLRMRLHLRLHLMMCGACSAYRRQILQLHHLFRRRFIDPADSPTDATPTPTRCPEDAKKRIETWLNQHLKG